MLDDDEPSAYFVPPGPRDDEKFEIDSSMFDIQNSPSPTSLSADVAKGGSAGSFNSKPPSKLVPEVAHTLPPSSALRWSSPVSQQSAPVYVSRSNPRMESTDQAVLTDGLGEVDPYQDDLAEFEEWLNSGAVVIVDHVD